MEFVIGGILAAVIVGLFFVGVGVGSAQNPPTVALPGDAPSELSCQSACSRWDNARQMLCGAKADEIAAKNRADGIRTSMLAFIATAVALTGAGVTALIAAAAATATFFGIPAGIVLTGVAIALFALAAAATAAAAVFAGELVVAEADAARKADARQKWDAEVALARSEVNAKCPVEQANACLSRAAPC